MTKRIALVGYFGWGNFGDELFVDTHRQMLEPEFSLFVANDLTDAPYFSQGVEPVLEEADAILIGGGDLINPLRVSELYWREEFLRRPVVIYGLGVPSQPFERKHVIDRYRAFLEHPNVKLVVTRDVESFQWMHANFDIAGKLEWYPDPVCAYRLPEARKSETPEFGIVMRSHRSLEHDFAALRRMADRARDCGYTVQHIVLANRQTAREDFELAGELAAAGEEVFRSESLSELCHQISGLSMLASIKFHGLVVATMYGIPTIAMSVTPKNRNFLRYIERPEMLVSYRDVGLADRVTAYPARIHSLVRENLERRAVEGYGRLRAVLRSL